MRSKSSYIIAILLVTVVLVAVACICLSAFGGAWRANLTREAWKAVFEKIDWNKFPWDSFPWSILPDSFPWDEVPWKKLPWEDIAKQVDWNSIDWDSIPFDKLPEDFPYDRLPLQEMPDSFWENIEWDNLSEDFPYDEVPWEERPNEFWDEFPFEEMPEEFPWQGLPWDNIEPEQVPDGVFPEGFYPEEWDHEHQFVSDEWTLVIPATCGTPGVEQNFCTICNKTITQKIPATGKHVFGGDGICVVCGMRRLILVSSSKQKEYDGMPLYERTLTLGIGSAQLLDGHRINYEAFTFEGCSGIMSVSNRFGFQGAAIVDDNGNDVTSSYALEYVYGTLTVTQRTIIITTEGAIRSFYENNGMELTNHHCNCIGLINGHHLTDVQYGEGQKEPGKRQNIITSYRIVDDDGNDVTEYYKVKFEFGWLELTI